MSPTSFLQSITLPLLLIAAGCIAETGVTTASSSTSPTTASPSATASVAAFDFGVGNFYVPVNLTNSTDPYLYTTPKFNDMAMGFIVVASTDYRAGAAYGNPDLYDSVLEPVKDLTTCISECAQSNLYMPPDDNHSNPACSGVVFFNGGSCWLKSGGLTNAQSSGDQSATAAILHVFQ